MPGAGKTTLVGILARQGHYVLGEYTAPTLLTVASTETTPAQMPQTLALREHPAVGDDDAHQANWRRKATQAAHALGHTGGRPVFTDRDWISALSYAYSIADTDDGRLLAARAEWAARLLATGELLLADTYAVFDLSIVLSMRRRSGALRPDHPWSRPHPLRRLQDFYQRPIELIQQHNAALATRLGTTRWIPVPTTMSPHSALHLVQTLAETP